MTELIEFTEAELNERYRFEWGMYSPFGKYPAFTIKGVMEEGCDISDKNMRTDEYVIDKNTFTSELLNWWEKSPEFNELKDTLENFSKKVISFSCIIYADEYMCGNTLDDEEDHDKVSDLRIEYIDGKMKFYKIEHPDVARWWYAK